MACPTCPGVLRAYGPYVPYVLYVPYVPTHPTCPRAQVYFTDWKIKNIGFNEGSFTDVLKDAEF